MFNRCELIDYACPTCNTGYGALPEMAGSNHHCEHCETDFTIPLGRTPKLVTVCDSPGRTLLPHEAEEVRRSLAIRPQMPLRRPQVMDEFDGEQEVPRSRLPAWRDDDKKVELGFGKYARLNVDVDGKTRNAMATTFLGGILVALGVFVATMFGIKKRS